MICEAVIDAINGLMTAKHMQAIQVGQVSWAFDKDVDFSAGPASAKISEENLCAAPEFEQRFAGVYRQGPSWVHANLLPRPNGSYVIAICYGQKVGNPSPSINVSLELNKQVIVDA